jgi:hypothetical protein
MIGFGRECDGDERQPRFNLDARRNLDNWAIGAAIILWGSEPRRPVGLFLDFGPWTVRAWVNMGREK